MDAAFLYSTNTGFLPVAFTGQVSEKPGREHVEFRGMGGGRSVSYRPVAARSWGVSGKVPLDWAQVLLQVQSGQFGHGPWVWLPPLAQRFNALTGGFVGAAPTAPERDSDGALVAASAVDAVLATPTTPIEEGLVVTGSAWVAGGQVSMEFLASGGGLLTSVAAAHSDVGLHRLSVSAPAPADAVSARVVVSADAVRAGQPSLSWSSTVAGYAPPGAASSVYVVPGDVGHGFLGSSAGRTLVDVSFEVLEVT